MAKAKGTVNLDVEGALQGAAEVRLLASELRRLDRSGKKLKETAKQIQSAGTSLQTITIAAIGTRKVFDNLDRGIKGFGTGMTKVLGTALKTTILQFGILSASLVSIHLLFMTGKGLQNTYAFMMTALAGAAAGAAVGLGVMAAAIREQSAAMYAYTKGGAGEFISGTNQVRVAMRTLHADSQLAGLGVESLNKAYAAMSKSMKSSEIAQTGAMMKKLMDFGAAGQDPAAAAEKVGALIEALENTKTSMSAVKEAAKGLGPQMEDALKKAKVTSKKQLKELIMSGELAKMGGVAGQFEAVNVTLVGQLKTYFTQLRTEFADFGQVFLGPAKVALEQIFLIIRKDLMRTGAALTDFGTGVAMDGLVSAVQKTSDFFVHLIRDWLPKTDRFFEKMSNWFSNVGRFFRLATENLRPFLEGAEAIEAMFSPIFQALKGGFTTSINNFNQRAIDSKEEFLEIGESLGALIDELFKLQEVFSQTFVDALPFLSDVVKGITQVVSLMTNLLSKFSGIIGGPAAYMGLMIMFRQMKAHTGGYLGKEQAPVNTMTVSAQVVNVNGRPIPGTPGAPGGPPAGPGGSGAPPSGIPFGPPRPPTGPTLTPSGPIQAIGPGATTAINSPMQPRYIGAPGISSGLTNAGVSRIDSFGPMATTTSGLLVPNSALDNARLSSGATGGSGGGGGGMPGPGGPGVAPPGADGPGTTGATRRLGFLGRMKQMSRQQALGPEGVGNDYLRTKGGRVIAGIDPDGSVQQLTRKVDPVTGQRITRNVGTVDRETGHMRTTGQGLGTKLRFAGRTSRAIRDSALGSSVLGNQKKGIIGANERMGAKMGVGMGMSALSQFMPEEAQGAMALGGMVGMYNPLAGAAIGLGGTALTARTAGGGALAGAGMGAAIGTMIAPGIGTAVGAGLGAITGAIMGFNNGVTQRAKEAKTAVNSFLDGISVREFSRQTAALTIQEERARTGLDIKGPGALQGVMRATAKQMQALESEFEGIDLGFETRADNRALNTSNLGYVGGNTGRATGTQATITRHASGQSSAALIGRAFFQAERAVGIALGEESTISKDNKNQKTAETIFQELVNDPMYKDLMTNDIRKKFKESPKEGLTELDNQFKFRGRAALQIADQQDKRMAMFTKMSGKSGAELEVLAKKLGVNLYDATLKTSEIVEKLGLNVVKTGQQMKELNTDTYINTISSFFDEAIAQLDAPKIYDERGTALKSVIQGGGSTSDILKSLQLFQESTLGMDDPIAAFYSQRAQLGTATAPGAIFGENASFAGVDPAKLFTPEISAILEGTFAKTEKGFVDNTAANISSMIARAGGVADTNQITRVINSLAPEQRQRLMTDMESGRFDIVDVFANKSADETAEFLKGGKFTTSYQDSNFDGTHGSVTTRTGTAKSFSSKEEFIAAQLSERFATYGTKEGTTFDVAGIDTGTNEVADKMFNASEGFQEAVKAFNRNMGQYFSATSGKPDWWSKEAMKEIMKDDTSTPRGGIVGDTTSSRLSQTMARHSSINGSIPGNRSITSSYRTVGLGSLNSDHVTGRAIDLVGQNLGSYAVATRNAGGFAEFHGSGKGRHLHAVPGPGAIGDASVPLSNQMRAQSAATVSANGNSFTFNINGGQNNPEEIASMVMAKIKTAEQRVIERS